MIEDSGMMLIRRRGTTEAGNLYATGKVLYVENQEQVRGVDQIELNNPAG